MVHLHTSEARARRRNLWWGLLGLIIIVAAVVSYFVSRGSVDVFSSAGPIGARQRQLIIFTCALALIVVIPVFILLFTIAWRYRESNTRARYNPEFDHSVLFESIWWAIPIMIIGTLAVVTWRSTHQLDPRVALVSDKKTLTVQVVALDWRWLFLYPEQGVASLSYVEMPVNRPVHFEITADAPMNSFWIPKLGGQIYAMAGMETQLYLMANQVGNYHGVSANISGAGFAGMEFTARAVPEDTFNAWAGEAKRNAPLTNQAYQLLSRPSTDTDEATYTLPNKQLFFDIMAPYMDGHGGHSE